MILPLHPTDLDLRVQIRRVALVANPNHRLAQLIHANRVESGTIDQSSRCRQSAGSCRRKLKDFELNIRASETGLDPRTVSSRSMEVISVLQEIATAGALNLAGCAGTCLLETFTWACLWSSCGCIGRARLLPSRSTGVS